MMETKILVATATYSGMEYCENKFFDKVLNLSYNSYDILVVDNSKEEEYSIKLREKFGVEVIWDDGEEKRSILRLIGSRNKILEYGIKNGYSHILMLDADVILPENIIEELLSCNKSLVGGIYYNYFNVNGAVRHCPVAWAYFSEKEFEEMKKLYPEVVSSKTRKDMKRYLTEEEVKSGELLEVAYPSAGCMLIRWEVFEKVRYGQEEDSNTGDDIYFINRARELGFESYCFTKVKCGHLVLEKYKRDEKGNYIYEDFLN